MEPDAGTISDVLSGVSQAWPRIAGAVVVLLAAVLLGRGLGAVAARALATRKQAQIHRKFVRNLIAWTFLFVGAMLALSVLGLGGVLTGLLAGSGVAAVVFGFAFREIGENLLAGVFLAFSRPFDVGDFIRSDVLEGEVRGIELRYTHIRTVDARDIYIPNAQIFNRPLVNYTRDGLRRPSFTVGIDYADDAERACGLLATAARSVAGVLADPPPAVSLVKLAPQFVELEVSFWINTFAMGPAVAVSPNKQEESLAGVRSRVMDACRRTLVDNGFTVSANVATSVALSRPPGDG